MKTATVLTRALALMEQGRWMQEGFEERRQRINNFGRRHGRRVLCFCAAGAIRHVTKDEEERKNAYVSLSSVVRGKFYGEDRIFSWNDNKRRTIGQVRAAFRKAIKRAA